MPILTAFILAAFGGYIAGWYFDMIEGNFALLLLLASVVTGIYWLAERFHFLPQRQAAAARLEADTASRREELQRMGIEKVDTDTREAQQKLLMQPWWLDWTAGLFPVIVTVFILRSFLFEPFKIPSGSMIPTLQIGDLILVNKFHYGIRLPVANTKVTAGTPVQRGDVMVFRYPPKPSVDYIKRVVGIPGDEVAYLNKKLTVNGQPWPSRRCPITSMTPPCATSATSASSCRARPTRSSSTTNAPPSFPVQTSSLSASSAATASRAWSARCPRATTS